MLKSKMFGTVVALLATTAIFSSCGGDQAAPKTAAAPGSAADTLSLSVSIMPGAAGMLTNAYSPNPAVITQGGTVTWTNNDTVNHTATGDNGEFDSGTLIPGQTFSFTFPTVGSIAYHCSIHGAASMSGTVTVTAPTVTATPSATPTATPSPTASPTVTPSATPTPTPSATVTPQNGQNQQQQS